jgi:hypoxanthine-guanine phosphoribosyltransferase
VSVKTGVCFRFFARLFHHVAICFAIVFLIKDVYSKKMSSSLWQWIFTQSGTLMDNPIINIVEDEDDEYTAIARLIELGRQSRMSPLMTSFISSLTQNKM